MEDKRIKYRYKGYLIRKTVDETGIVSKTEMYIGDTYAISRAKAISNARQVRNLKSVDDYCVVCTNGLMGQPYDMLEHRQDMCFKLNAWQQDSDVWVTMKHDEVEEMLQVFFNLFNLFRKELTNYENNTDSGHDS